MNLEKKYRVPDCTYTIKGKNYSRNSGKIIMIIEHEKEYIVKVGKGMYSRVTESKLKELNKLK